MEKLEQVWRVVDKKDKTMTENDWNFFHTYPNNSPVRRIIAQSYLLQRYCKKGLLKGILQLVREVSLMAGYRVLEDSLIVTGDGYWQDHFDFSVTSKTRASAILGRGKAAEIIVNVILPFAFCCGEISGEPELKQKAMTLYLNYPKLAENEITRHMTKQLGFEGPNKFVACHQQGLIHIFRTCCREGMCTECPVFG